MPGGRLRKRRSQSILTCLGGALLLVLGVPHRHTVAATVAPELEWEKWFGEEMTREVGWAVVQSRDDDLVIAGTSKDGADFRVYLVRLSKDGNLRWEYTYGEQIYGVACIQETRDLGYVVIGSVDRGVPFPGYTDVYFLKTDLGGQVVFEKSIGGTDRNAGTWVHQTRDDGFVIAATTTKSQGATTQSFLIKTDVDGNRIWERRFTTFSGIRVSFVDEAPDGGLILAGSAGQVNPEMYLARTDHFGDVIWEEKYGPSAATSVACAQEGGYIAIGHGGLSTVRVVRIDPTGARLSEIVIDSPFSDDVYPPRFTRDGGYIFPCRYDGVQCGIALVRSDPNGTIAWTRKFSKSSENACAGSVIQENAGGYVLIGGVGGDIYGARTKPDDLDSQYFLRGDSNSDGFVDISDCISTLEWLFLGATEPACIAALDSNDTGTVDLSDPIYTIMFLFNGDGRIPPPYPLRGIDPSLDNLRCRS